VLGLGVFFLDKFNQSANGGNGIIAARTLFGSIFGLSSGQAQLAALIGIVVVAGVTAIGRPLLFATIDPQVAASRGVPVGLVGAGFLVLLGLVAAEATQAVGALLLLGLIAAPGGAALKLTANAYLALALSCVVRARVRGARDRRRLRDPVAPAEHRDHRHRSRDLRGDVRAR
jgi:ABC-type Mn2+/Zn2+ transport systems, permease components